MGSPILKQETVSLFRECVLIAEDRHLFGLRRALVQEGLCRELLDAEKARLVFESLIATVDWCNAQASEPLLHIFEEAYAESPIAQNSIHAAIDRELAKEGLKVEDGKILRLVEG